MGEPIKLKVKARKESYIYIFSMTDDRAVMIFPNRRDKDNKVKAGRETVVPKKSVFKATKEGVEHFVMVASARRLDLKSAGEKDFTDLAKADYEEATKSIRVESGRETGGGMVEELDVVIEGRGGSADLAYEDDDRPAVLVSTDRPSYLVGDEMTLLFAADRDGYVEIYQVYPDGDVELVTGQDVETGMIYKIKSEAEDPDGEYHIAAMAYGDLTGSVLDALLGGKAPAPKEVAEKVAAELKLIDAHEGIGLDEGGNFSAKVMLKVGENAVEVQAMDLKGNVASRTVTITRGATLAREMEGAAATAVAAHVGVLRQRAGERFSVSGEVR